MIVANHCHALAAQGPLQQEHYNRPITTIAAAGLEQPAAKLAYPPSPVVEGKPVPGIGGAAQGAARPTRAKHASPSRLTAARTPAAIQVAANMAANLQVRLRDGYTCLLFVLLLFVLRFAAVLPL